MAESKITIELSNSLSELDRLNEALERFGSANGFLPRCVMEINLAIDEIFTNIVSYGFDDEKEHRIVICVSCTEKRITIRVTDDGCPFDPIKTVEPDTRCALSERKVGGLGIHIAKRIMDSLLYKREGERNILVMEKARCVQ